MIFVLGDFGETQVAFLTTFPFTLEAFLYKSPCCSHSFFNFLGDFAHTDFLLSVFFRYILPAALHSCSPKLLSCSSFSCKVGGFTLACLGICDFN